jgi:hypothetical protein
MSWWDEYDVTSADEFYGFSSPPRAQLLPECDTGKPLLLPVQKPVSDLPDVHTGPSTTRGLSQVAGMATLKEQLVHDVIGPFKDPELYARYRVSIPNGILFYGPPGCGKTYVARALAEELAWSFQYCRPSDVASPYIHDTVKQIRAVFSRAIENAPSLYSLTNSRRLYRLGRSWVAINSTRPKK